ncbi:AAA family ATPase [Nocardioides sp. NPDC000445]|uniref:helix-turn-helix transcriptional regulator n=1 Tax=Nocardioides sp. NPDC000445 TaxID=3154257 RepID=UPI0033269178
MLIGRDEEKQQVERLLAEACKERGGALVVRGEPGIGKSVLLDHAVSVAKQQGMAVVRSTGVESDATLVYGGLHQLLYPHLDRVQTLPAPQAAALRVALGLAEGDEANHFLVSAGTLGLLADLAEEAPLLCVVDDLQWIDQESVAALLFAARRLSADRIAMLFAVREASLPFETPSIDVLHLQRLTSDDAGRLLDARAPRLADPLRARVIEESHGNPLAILELSSAHDDVLDHAEAAGRVGALPVAHRVQDVFRRQIAALPVDTRRALLVVAADAGAPLTTMLRVVEDLGGAAADLEPAERAALIQIGTTVTFQHPLVRAAAYQGEPLHRRIEVHHAYAAVLSAATDADRRVWHLSAATTAPDEAVAAELEAAAERSQRRGAAMAVSAAFERAGRLSVDQQSMGRRIAGAAQAAFDAGKPDRASRLAAEALALATDPGVRAEAIYVRGAVAYERASPRTDAELTIEAATLVRETDPERAALNLYEAVHAARHGAAHDLLDQAADLMRDLTPPPHWAPVVDALVGWAELFAGRPDLAIGPMRALQAAGGGEDASLMRRMTAGIGGLLIGDEDDVVAEMDELLAQVRTSGALAWVPYALNSLALARLQRGEFADAHACVAEGAEIADELGNTTEGLANRSIEVWLHAVRGEEDRCRDLAARVLPEARTRHRVNAELAGWGVAMLDLSARRFGAALDGLDEVCRGPAHRDVVRRAVPDLVEAAARSDAPDRCREALTEFARWAEHVDRPVTTGLLLRSRALLAEDAEADGLYAEALRLHEGHAGPYDLARTRLVYGEWLRRRRRRTEARARLVAAISDFERLGSRLWAERARGELNALGGAREEQHVDGPLTLLTPQEWQIVQLAAAGHTNKEIAAKLYLSPRTVGHHLYKAYPKLGVTARSELAKLTGHRVSETSHRD